MKNIIFYFTGMGNSSDIAQNVAKGIIETELVSIYRQISSGGFVGF